MELMENNVTSKYANRKTGKYCVQWDFRFNGKNKQVLSVVKSRVVTLFNFNIQFELMFG